MYTGYIIYGPDETGNDKFDILRNEMNWQGQSMYGLMDETGNIGIVQADSCIPYPGKNIEESAKNHLKHLEQEEEDARLLAEEEKAKKEAEAKRQSDLEETVKKQTEAINMLTQMMAMMQMNQNSSNQ